VRGDAEVALRGIVSAFAGAALVPALRAGSVNPLMVLDTYRFL
jgi:hypothetical protein